MDKNTTTQAGDRQTIEDKFLSATAIARTLFDLLATAGSCGDLDSLLPNTVCIAGLNGVEAVQAATDAFEELQKLYHEAVKAQEAQS